MPTHALIDAFRAAGQGQVFRFFDKLDEAGRDRLLAQAAEIDLGELARLKATLLGECSAAGEGRVGGGAAGGAGVDLSDLEPAPYEPLPEHGGDAAEWAAARSAGEAALRAGRVAAFTVAGGQGTRLGFDGPKGTFPVTPLRAKSLFQVFAEKLLAAQRRYGRPLHWFIMTSTQNHEATAQFFAEHAYFGLAPERVHLFRQGRMPAVDFEGRILLEAPDRIAMSPDGHGGSLRALSRSGALDLMAREGIDTLSYFQVDNPMVRCIDPAFIGWHLLRGSEMSSKMLPKAHAAEKLGHFCMQRGRLVVVEYSDLPQAMQEERAAATGELRFNAGSIAIHLLNREFVRRMSAGGAESLGFHRADKKIPTLDETGQPLSPPAPNGVKFELFVFDALPFARNPVVIETSRADEFSPVKNATGADSPQSCRADQLRQYARWFAAAGLPAGQLAPLALDASGLPQIGLEVSPLFAEDAASFAESWAKLSPPPPIADGLYLE
ncbi:2-alkenal reductase [Cephaloticoccus primus]|uniref:2-alkenal reductase n=1 Tax=Cephaloticoccus primus TaxID=1548207 RepID=A0A139SSP3_9BACT|nr:UDPGP type 1 family protein [Cephaloticoccus primus]KXU37593.1 2-alkenal reductase [Cephaloticoccus primus]